MSNQILAGYGKNRKVLKIFLSKINFVLLSHSVAKRASAQDGETERWKVRD